jgi:hypothetical protein
MAPRLLYGSRSLALMPGFVSNRANPRAIMNQLETSLREVAQIRTLIVTLSRSVDLLNWDIDAEEERTRLHDLSDPAYPILARTLRTRRDNLSATIAALRERVQEAQFEPNTAPRIGKAGQEAVN